MRRLPALVLLALPAALGACGKLDHFGRPPTMSSVQEPRHPIDPTLPTGPEIETRSLLSPAPEHGVDGVDPRLYAPQLGRQPMGGPVGGAGAGRGAGPAGPRTGPGRYGDPRLAFAEAAAGGRLSPSRTASLWSSQPSSLFGDRRARGVGDILTVLIDINDNATLNNTTTRQRSGSDQITADTAFGLPELVDRIIPGDQVAIRNGLDTNGASQSNGTGSITRDEVIQLRIAATVVEVLPNGHFVITGSQEVRVNFELRDLQVAGVIRPEDVSRRNEITYDKIARARISYGGRGQITDFQQPRIGQQVVDLVSPF